MEEEVPFRRREHAKHVVESHQGRIAEYVHQSSARPASERPFRHNLLTAAAAAVANSSSSRVRASSSRATADSRRQQDGRFLIHDEMVTRRETPLSLSGQPVPPPFRLQLPGRRANPKGHPNLAAKLQTGGGQSSSSTSPAARPAPSPRLLPPLLYDGIDGMISQGLAPAAWFSDAPPVPGRREEESAPANAHTTGSLTPHLKDGQIVPMREKPAAEMQVFDPPLRAKSLWVVRRGAERKEWRQCSVLAYDPEEKQYVIRWEFGNSLEKRVSPMQLSPEGEDIEEAERRIAEATARRDEVEKSLTEQLVLHELARWEQGVAEASALAASKEHILRMAQTDLYNSSPQVLDDLVKEVHQNWCYAQAKAILLWRRPDLDIDPDGAFKRYRGANRQHEPPVPLEPRRVLSRVPTRVGVVRRTEQFQRQALLGNQTTLTRLLRIFAICRDVLLHGGADGAGGPTEVFEVPAKREPYSLLQIARALANKDARIHSLFRISWAEKIAQVFLQPPQAEFCPRMSGLAANLMAASLHELSEEALKVLTSMAERYARLSASVREGSETVTYVQPPVYQASHVCHYEQHPLFRVHIVVEHAGHDFDPAAEIATEAFFAAADSRTLEILLAKKKMEELADVLRQQHQEEAAAHSVEHLYPDGAAGGGAPAAASIAIRKGLAALASQMALNAATAGATEPTATPKAADESSARASPRLFSKDPSTTDATLFSHGGLRVRLSANLHSFQDALATHFCKVVELSEQFQVIDSHLFDYSTVNPNSAHQDDYTWPCLRSLQETSGKWVEKLQEEFETHLESCFFDPHVVVDEIDHFRDLLVRFSERRAQIQAMLQQPMLQDRSRSKATLLSPEPDASPAHTKDDAASMPQDIDALVPRSLDETEEQLQMIDTWFSELKDTPKFDLRHMGLIVIDIAPLRRAGLAMCACCRLRLLGYTQRRLEESCAQLMKELQTKYAEIIMLPKTADELQSTLEAVNSLEHFLEETGPQLHFIRLSLELLNRWSHQVPKAVLQLWYNCMHAVPDLRDRANRWRTIFRKDLRSRFNLKIADHAKHLEAQCRDCKKVLEDLSSKVSLNKAEFYHGKMKQLQTRIIGIQDQVKKQHLHEQMMDLPPSDFPWLSAMAEQIEPLLELWYLAHEWIQWKDEILYGEFARIDPDAVKARLSMCTDTLRRLEGVFSSQPRPRQVLHSLSLELTELRVLLPLIISLRNPGLRERHWQLIGEAINQTIQLNQMRDISLSVMNERFPFVSHLTTIEDIASMASKELVVETQLDEMEAEWTNLTITVEVCFEETSTDGTRDVDEEEEERIYKADFRHEEVWDLITSQMAALKQMAQNQNAAVHAKRLTRHDEKLKTIGELCDLLHESQYAYLQTREQLVSDGIVQDLLQKEGNREWRRFMDVDKHWQHIMEYLRNQTRPNWMALIEVTRISESCYESAAILDWISKAVHDVLNRRRAQVPLTYRLTDIQLMQVLLRGHDPTLPEVRPCFPGIVALDTESRNDEGAESVAIVGVLGQSGEYVPLSSEVTTSADTPLEDWVAALLTSMQSSLMLVMVAILKERRSISSPSFMTEAVPLQVRCAGLDILMTSEVEGALREGTGKFEFSKRISEIASAIGLLHRRQLPEEIIAVATDMEESSLSTSSNDLDSILDDEESEEEEQRNLSDEHLLDEEDEDAEPTKVAAGAPAMSTEKSLVGSLLREASELSERGVSKDVGVTRARHCAERRAHMCSVLQIPDEKAAAVPGRLHLMNTDAVIQLLLRWKETLELLLRSRVEGVHAHQWLLSLRHYVILDDFHQQADVQRSRSHGLERSRSHGLANVDIGRYYLSHGIYELGYAWQYLRHASPMVSSAASDRSMMALAHAFVAHRGILAVSPHLGGNGLTTQLAVALGVQEERCMIRWDSEVAAIMQQVNGAMLAGAWLSISIDSSIRIQVLATLAHELHSMLDVRRSQACVGARIYQRGVALSPQPPPVSRASASKSAVHPLDSLRAKSHITLQCSEAMLASQRLPLLLLQTFRPCSMPRPATACFCERWLIQTQRLSAWHCTVIARSLALLWQFVQESGLAAWLQHGCVLSAYASLGSLPGGNTHPQGHGYSSLVQLKALCHLTASIAASTGHKYHEHHHSHSNPGGHSVEQQRDLQLGLRKSVVASASPLEARAFGSRKSSAGGEAARAMTEAATATAASAVTGAPVWARVAMLLAFEALYAGSWSDNTETPVERARVQIMSLLQIPEDVLLAAESARKTWSSSEMVKAAFRSMDLAVLETQTRAASQLNMWLSVPEAPNSTRAVMLLGAAAAGKSVCIDAAVQTWTKTGEAWEVRRLSSATFALDAADTLGRVSEDSRLLPATQESGVLAWATSAAGAGGRSTSGRSVLVHIDGELGPSVQSSLVASLVDVPARTRGQIASSASNAARGLHISEHSWLALQAQPECGFANEGSVRLALEMSEEASRSMGPDLVSRCGITYLACREDADSTSIEEVQAFADGWVKRVQALHGPAAADSVSSMCSTVLLPLLHVVWGDISEEDESLAGAQPPPEEDEEEEEMQPRLSRRRTHNPQNPPTGSAPLAFSRTASKESSTGANKDAEATINRAARAVFNPKSSNRRHRTGQLSADILRLPYRWIMPEIPKRLGLMRVQHAFDTVLALKRGVSQDGSKSSAAESKQGAVAEDASGRNHSDGDGDAREVTPPAAGAPTGQPSALEVCTVLVYCMAWSLAPLLERAAWPAYEEILMRLIELHPDYLRVPLPVEFSIFDSMLAESHTHFQHLDLGLENTDRKADMDAYVYVPVPCARRFLSLTSMLVRTQTPMVALGPAGAGKTSAVGRLLSLLPLRGEPQSVSQTVLPFATRLQPHPAAGFGLGVELRYMSVTPSSPVGFWERTVCSNMINSSRHGLRPPLGQSLLVIVDDCHCATAPTVEAWRFAFERRLLHSPGACARPANRLQSKAAAIAGKKVERLEREPLPCRIHSVEGVSHLLIGRTDTPFCDQHRLMRHAWLFTFEELRESSLHRIVSENISHFLYVADIPDEICSRKSRYISLIFGWSSWLRQHAPRVLYTPRFLYRFFKSLLCLPRDWICELSTQQFHSLVLHELIRETMDRLPAPRAQQVAFDHLAALQLKHFGGLEADGTSLGVGNKRGAPHASRDQGEEVAASEAGSSDSGADDEADDDPKVGPNKHAGWSDELEPVIVNVEAFPSFAVSGVAQALKSLRYSTLRPAPEVVRAMQVKKSYSPKQGTTQAAQANALELSKLWSLMSEEDGLSDMRFIRDGNPYEDVTNQTTHFLNAVVAQVQQGWQLHDYMPPLAWSLCPWATKPEQELLPPKISRWASSSASEELAEVEATHALVDASFVDQLLTLTRLLGQQQFFGSEPLRSAMLVCTACVPSAMALVKVFAQINGLRFEAPDGHEQRFYGVDGPTWFEPGLRPDVLRSWLKEILLRGVTEHGNLPSVACLRPHLLNQPELLAVLHEAFAYASPPEDWFTDKERKECETAIVELEQEMMKAGHKVPGLDDADEKSHRLSRFWHEAHRNTYFILLSEQQQSSDSYVSASSYFSFDMLQAHWPGLLAHLTIMHMEPLLASTVQALASFHMSGPCINSETWESVGTPLMNQDAVAVVVEQMYKAAREVSSREGPDWAPPLLRTSPDLLAEQNSGPTAGATEAVVNSLASSQLAWSGCGVHVGLRPMRRQPLSDVVDLLTSAQSLMELRSRHLEARLESLQDAIAALDHVQGMNCKADASEAEQHLEAAIAEWKLASQRAEEIRQLHATHQKDVSDVKEHLLDRITFLEKQTEEAEQQRSQALKELELSRLQLVNMAKTDATELKALVRSHLAAEKSGASAGQSSAAITALFTICTVALRASTAPTRDEVRATATDSLFTTKLAGWDAETSLSVHTHVMEEMSQNLRREDFAETRCLALIAAVVFQGLTTAINAQKIPLFKAELAELNELRAARAEEIEGLQQRDDELRFALQQASDQESRRQVQMQHAEAVMQRATQKAARANSFATSTADDKARWRREAQDLEDRLDCLIGDCLVGAAAAIYFGPLGMEGRTKLLGRWCEILSQANITVTQPWTLTSVWLPPLQRQKWVTRVSLLHQEHLLEGAVLLMMQSSVWPLLYDPDGVASEVLQSLYPEAAILSMGTPEFHERLIATLTQAAEDPRKPCTLIIENTYLPSLQEDASLKHLLSRRRLFQGPLHIPVGGDDVVKVDSRVMLIFVTSMGEHLAKDPSLTSRFGIIDFRVDCSGLCLHETFLNHLFSHCHSQLFTEWQAHVHERVGLVEEWCRIDTQLIDVLREHVNNNELRSDFFDQEDNINQYSVVKAELAKVERRMLRGRDAEAKTSTARTVFDPLSALMSSITCFAEHARWLCPNARLSVAAVLRAVQRELPAGAKDSAKERRASDGPPDVAEGQWMAQARKDVVRCLWRRCRPSLPASAVLPFAFQMALSSSLPHPAIQSLLAHVLLHCPRWDGREMDLDLPSFYSRGMVTAGTKTTAAFAEDARSEGDLATWLCPWGPVEGKVPDMLQRAPGTSLQERRRQLLKERRQASGWYADVEGGSTSPPGAGGLLSASVSRRTSARSNSVVSVSYGSSLQVPQHLEVGGASSEPPAERDTGDSVTQADFASRRVSQAMSMVSSRTNSIRASQVGDLIGGSLESLQMTAAGALALEQSFPDPEEPEAQAAALFLTTDMWSSIPPTQYVFLGRASYFLTVFRDGLQQAEQKDHTEAAIGTRSMSAAASWASHMWQQSQPLAGMLDLPPGGLSLPPGGGWQSASPGKAKADGDASHAPSRVDGRELREFFAAGQGFFHVVHAAPPWIDPEEQHRAGMHSPQNRMHHGGDASSPSPTHGSAEALLGRRRRHRPVSAEAEQAETGNTGDLHADAGHAAEVHQILARLLQPDGGGSQVLQTVEWPMLRHLVEKLEDSLVNHTERWMHFAEEVLSGDFRQQGATGKSGAKAKDASEPGSPSASPKVNVVKDSRSPRSEFPLLSILPDELLAMLVPAHSIKGPMTLTLVSVMSYLQVMLLTVLLSFSYPAFLAGAEAVVEALIQEDALDAPPLGMQALLPTSDSSHWPVLCFSEGSDSGASEQIIRMAAGQAERPKLIHMALGGQIVNAPTALGTSTVVRVSAAILQERLEEAKDVGHWLVLHFAPNGAAVMPSHEETSGSSQDVVCPYDLLERCWCFCAALRRDSVHDSFRCFVLVDMRGSHSLPRWLLDFGEAMSWHDGDVSPAPCPRLWFQRLARLMKPLPRSKALIVETEEESVPKHRRASKLQAAFRKARAALLFAGVNSPSDEQAANGRRSIRRSTLLQLPGAQAQATGSSLKVAGLLGDSVLQKSSKVLPETLSVLLSTPAEPVGRRINVAMPVLRVIVQFAYSSLAAYNAGVVGSPSFLVGIQEAHPLDGVVADALICRLGQASAAETGTALLSLWDLWNLLESFIVGKGGVQCCSLPWSETTRSAGKLALHHLLVGMLDAWSQKEVESPKQVPGSKTAPSPVPSGTPGTRTPRGAGSKTPAHPPDTKTPPQLAGTRTPPPQIIEAPPVPTQVIAPEDILRNSTRRNTRQSMMSRASFSSAVGGGMDDAAATLPPLLQEEEVHLWPFSTTKFQVDKANKLVEALQNFSHIANKVGTSGEASAEQLEEAYQALLFATRSLPYHAPDTALHYAASDRLPLVMSLPAMSTGNVPFAGLQNQEVRPPSTRQGDRLHMEMGLLSSPLAPFPAGGAASTEPLPEDEDEEAGTPLSPLQTDLNRAEVASALQSMELAAQPYSPESRRWSSRSSIMPTVRRSILHVTKHQAPLAAEKLLVKAERVRSSEVVSLNLDEHAINKAALGELLSAAIACIESSPLLPALASMESQEEESMEDEPPAVGMPSAPTTFVLDDQEVTEVAEEATSPTASPTGSGDSPSDGLARRRLLTKGLTIEIGRAQEEEAPAVPAAVEQVPPANAWLLSKSKGLLQEAWRRDCRAVALWASAVLGEAQIMRRGVLEGVEPLGDALLLKLRHLLHCHAQAELAKGRGSVPAADRPPVPSSLQGTLLEPLDQDAWPGSCPGSVRAAAESELALALPVPSGWDEPGFPRCHSYGQWLTSLVFRLHQVYVELKLPRPLPVLGLASMQSLLWALRMKLAVKLRVGADRVCLLFEPVTPSEHEEAMSSPWDRLNEVAPPSFQTDTSPPTDDLVASLPLLTRSMVSSPMVSSPRDSFVDSSMGGLSPRSRKGRKASLLSAPDSQPGSPLSTPRARRNAARNRRGGEARRPDWQLEDELSTDDLVLTNLLVDGAVWSVRNGLYVHRSIRCLTRLPPLRVRAATPRAAERVLAQRFPDANGCLELPVRRVIKAGWGDHPSSAPTLSAPETVDLFTIRLPFVWGDLSQRSHPVAVYDASPPMPWRSPFYYQSSPAAARGPQAHRGPGFGSLRLATPFNWHASALAMFGSSTMAG